MELNPLLVSVIVALVLGITLTFDIARRSARDAAALREVYAAGQATHSAADHP